MRDYVLEYLGKIKRKDQQPFHDEWSKIPALVAVKDIANCSKHFVLRDRKTTNRNPPSNMAVRPRRSKFVDVYSNGKGKFEFVEVDKPDISIKLSDDTVLLLHELTHEIMSYWREYLSRLGITVRRQPVSQLIGNVA
ncbi:hypothetical protein [Burkholderia vietnamiensis]|uniref:hypothetical protein n=1 Tax=Burkholderia vietnamiensis TaxID=60552 RepID=UPI0026514612|nr:hypothetical protein [Burkholderia vietnamiensis]MDN7819865.1 hypothetical protein [Burkholderia vietnamiensis]